MNIKHATPNTTGVPVCEPDMPASDARLTPKGKSQTTSDHAVEEPWIGTAASAKHLGASVPTFRRWLKQGLVTAKRTPTGELRFRRSELNNLLS